MKKKTKLLKGICLMVFTILIMIIFFEFILRVTYPLYSNYNSEMWRYSSEVKLIPTKNELCHFHISNKKGTYYGVNIQTNSMGLRAEKEYVVPKPEGVIRILVLGDSIAMGWGVNYNDSYPKVLESLLNKKDTYEIINAGVGNYNLQCAYNSLNKFLSLDPDIIVLSFFINDIERISYPKPIVYLIKSRSYLYSFVYDKYSKIYYGSEQKFIDYYNSLYANNKLKTDLKETFYDFSLKVEKKSIPLVFVNIPFLYDFDNYPFIEINKYIKSNLTSSSNVIYVDVLDAFKGKNASSLWISKEDAHPNKEAHKIIGNQIYRDLIKNNLI